MYQKLKENLKALLNLDANPHSIALAFSIGVFITMTPFYGIHFWIVILVSVIFKLNHLACITGSLVNIPPIAPFVYTVSYIIGKGITGGGIGSREIGDALHFLVRGDFDRLFGSISLDMVMSSFIALFTGCMIFGLFAALISYRAIMLFFRMRMRKRQS